MALWHIWKDKKEKGMKTKAQNPIRSHPAKEKITKQSIEKELKDIDDAVISDILIENEPITIVYLSSMVDKAMLQKLVFEPLTNLRHGVVESIISVAEEIREDELHQLIFEITEGHTALLFPKRKLILRINTYSAPQRNISVSEAETTVLGPQDSFVEELSTNLSLIKRRIATPYLKTKVIRLGTETRNKVAVLYMEDLANQENVDRVIQRIQNIEFHGFIGLPVMKQMLEDKPYSPFPQLGLTGRPDQAVTALLDGRIIVFLNGTPEAAICPTTFLEMFTTPEDFYNRWTTASLLRCIRFFGFFVTILLTPLYVSALTYHPEILPPQLLSLIIESRLQVPFPPVLEVMIIELVIEILREAGARMPTKIGQTIGIVGGIVIGTAAVDAGLASNIIIVLVAISALLSFIPPNYMMSNASRFVRYIFILAAGLYGLYGQMIAFAWLIAHLTNLTSLGSPYMTPLIPRSWSDLLDSIIRGPIQFFFSRKGVSRAKKDLIRPLDEE